MKRRILPLGVLAILLVGPATIPAAIALDSPSAVSKRADRATQKKRLFDRLKNARDQAEGQRAEKAIWAFWLAGAPNETVRELVEKAMERRRNFDLHAAENLLDEAVALAPRYAEAFNQRAFVRFMREKHSGALDDIERALELEPDHFGALAGLYHVLARQGRMDAAFGALRKAVRIHPWIMERLALPALERPAAPIEL